MEFVETALKYVAKTVSAYRNITAYAGNTSLNDINKLTRVEPLTIVSKDCANLDYIADVCKTALDLSAASYLQAINILTRVTDVEIIRVLDKLNPDRDATGWILSQDMASMESFRTLSMESYKHSLPIKGVKPALEQDGGDLLKETSNMAVGKLINVKIGYKVGEGKDAELKEHTLPIQFRLAIRLVPYSVTSALLAPSTHDKSILERGHAARAGRIDWIKDFVMARDLIDEYKKNAIEDETDTIQEVYRRVANAKKFGILTKNPSLNVAANTVILTEEAAREVEVRLGGRLSNAATRNKAFEDCYATTICVIDRERERITFYTYGVSAGMDLSISQIRNLGGKKGLDVMDVMKAFSMGAPAF